MTQPQQMLRKFPRQITYMSEVLPTREYLFATKSHLFSIFHGILKHFLGA